MTSSARFLVGVLALLVAVQGRRLSRAVTMDVDHAAYWRRRRRSPGDLLLVALGDSLALGLGAMHPEHSWAGRLADHLEATRHARVRVVNLAATGATVADVLRTQMPAVPAEAFTDPRATVALTVGTNDASDTEPEVFRAQLTELCAALPDGALVADVPDFQRGPDRSGGARLSAVAREVVAGFPRLRAVGLEAATRKMRLWELGPDLAHPSGLGYRRFGRAFVLRTGAPSATER